MNLPQVYMCSPSWTLLPPPPHSIPLGRPSAPAPSIQYRVSNLDWQLISYMIFYMFQCHSPKSSHPLPLPQSPLSCFLNYRKRWTEVHFFNGHLNRVVFILNPSLFWKITVPLNQQILISQLHLKHACMHTCVHTHTAHCIPPLYAHGGLYYN